MINNGGVTEWLRSTPGTRVERNSFEGSNPSLIAIMNFIERFEISLFYLISKYLSTGELICTSGFPTQDFKKK